MDALELLERYVEVPEHKRFYPAGEGVPLDGVVPGEWRQAVLDEHGKIERVPRELCVLRALRDAIRRREIHVDGAVAGAIPTRSCQPSSSATGPCTTRRSTNRWTRQRSSPISSSGCKPRSAAS